jgi:predicted RNA binding protein with dsRBD fold (UPF0201 family)
MTEYKSPTEDLEKRLDAVLETLEKARIEFEEATQLVSIALTHIHQRLEDLESWKNEKVK